VAVTPFLSDSIELIEKCNLLGYREFFSAAAIGAQAEAAAVIGTPLAMMAI
jgi:hypothetical protein